MHAFFQGKIDTFCAIYAVLNAMQILHDITPGKAREIFNEVIVDQSRNEALFRDVLSHRTDYVDLVDRMLMMLKIQYSLLEGPHFSPDTPQDTVWEALKNYASPELRRTAVFRFRRFVPLRANAMADHWTTSLRMKDNTLHFFDCSLEAQGLYSLTQDKLSAHPGPVDREYVVIAPESVRLLRR